MSGCPCGSDHPYKDCCGQHIENNIAAPTPEALMRSRYCAYTKAKVDYIEQTMRGKALSGFDKAAAKIWVERCQWLKLCVLNATPIKNNKASVEFIARYDLDSKREFIYEWSQFEFIDGRWFYVDGKSPKLGRNALCPCGSGEKIKRCSH